MTTITAKAPNAVMDLIQHAEGMAGTLSPVRVWRWRPWSRPTAGAVYLSMPGANARTHWLRDHARLPFRSHVALLVLTYLLDCADRDTLESFPSQRRIAEAVSASVRQVRTALGKLERLGMVRILPGEGVTGPSGYTTNRYRVLIRECMCSGHYDQNGRERPGSNRVESREQIARLSTERKSHPSNVLTPPSDSPVTFLTACASTRDGRHRPDPEGFCYSCGRKT
jgi:hypothetical protein